MISEALKRHLEPAVIAFWLWGNSSTHHSMNTDSNSWPLPPGETQQAPGLRLPRGVLNPGQGPRWSRTQSQARKMDSPDAQEKTQKWRELRNHKHLLIYRTHLSTTKTTFTGSGAPNSPQASPSWLYFSPLDWFAPLYFSLHCTGNVPCFVSCRFPLQERVMR